MKLDVVVKDILDTRLYGEIPLSITQIIHYYSKTGVGGHFFKEYGADVDVLKRKTQEFISQKEFALSTSDDIKVLPSTQELIETVFENAKLESNMTLNDLELFMLSLYDFSLGFGVRELKGKNDEGSSRLNLLIESGFDFNRFLDFVESPIREIKALNMGEKKKDPLNKKKSIIDELCVNLNQKAMDGEIDPVIGRDDEILRVAEVLGKRKKNNPVLIGKAGVGKTCIAEGLALKIVSGDVPETLTKGVVYNLEVANMVAGTQYRGQFEEKVMNLLKEFEELEKEGSQMPILFIDEIHSIVGSGNSNGLDLANIIKPALSKGKLRCIGATTPEEFTKFINQDKALKRRFSQIDIVEPTRSQTIEILKQARKYYEKKHELSYTDDSCERTVDLAMEFITDSALPDKAIDLFDLAGSMHRIKKVKEVNVPEIEIALNRARGIALDAIRQNREKKTEEPMAPKIKQSLFGQDKAVDKVVEVLEYSLAGLQDENKPLGSFLFIGPTGVGKTELAKLLAKELKAHFERIDMSEFMEQHSVAKLIGSPPGYVGFDAGGRLTKVIETNPRCVLLLDEMENSHPRVQDILLQAMDNARITDSQGNEISFKNVLILMTSNAGAREMNRKRISMGSELTERKRISQNNIEAFFSPEFRGRLNGVVEFNALDKQFMTRIVDKKVKDLNNTRLLTRGHITVSPEASLWIVEKSYNPDLGARPIEDAVKKYIYTEIKNSILYGDMKEGFRNVEVSVNTEKDELSFKYIKKNKKELTNA